MAKKSWFERDKRKRKTVQKYAEFRELKAKKDYSSLLSCLATPKSDQTCQPMPRDRSPSWFMRRFKISRITFRELAAAGMIPGVTKSSW
jgi:small subunit ribosomal protein S14